MNKNGVIAVVVVVVAVVLIGLWAMRGTQQSTGRMDCSAAPGAPTNLAHSKKTDFVTLTWTPPAGRDGVSTYVVEVGNAAGTNNVATFVAPGTATSFERQAPVGTYYVRVLARNACGTSPPSNETVATVP